MMMYFVRRGMPAHNKMKRVVTYYVPSVWKFACRRPTALSFTSAPSGAGWLRVSARTHHHYFYGTPANRTTTTTTGTTTARTLCSDAEDSENTISPKHAAVHDAIAAFNQEDLRDLNAEIGGFVGALGDADFDLEHDALDRKKAELGRRRKGPALGGHSRDPASQPRDEGDEGEYPVPSSGDWPDEPHDACTSLDVVGLSRRNAPGNKTRSGGGSSGEKAHISDDGYSAGAIGDSAFGDGEEATGGKKSVLVLNGAACFIGGRLASTGELQKHVTDSMERAAAGFGLSLTVCSSNREEVLLDGICNGRHDAIVYNPAGIGPPGAARNSPRRNSNMDTTNVASSPGPGTRERPQMQRAERTCPEDRSALQYALARAGCPVVTILPVDLLGHESRRSKEKTDGADEQRYVCSPGRVIAGFKGASSYSLAMAAVASLLEGDGHTVG